MSSGELIRALPDRFDAAPAVPDRGEPVPVGNLAAALAAAREQCKQADKDGYNPHHRYHYASADEVIATAKAALAGTGLALIPVHEEMTVAGTGNLAFYALNRKWLLAHASGEALALAV